MIVTPERRLAVGAEVRLMLRGAFDPAGSGVPSGFTIGDVECDRAVTEVRVTADRSGYRRRVAIRWRHRRVRPGPGSAGAPPDEDRS